MQTYLPRPSMTCGTASSACSPTSHAEGSGASTTGPGADPAGQTGHTAAHDVDDLAAGMWTIALMPVVGVGCMVRSARGEAAGATAAALTTLVIFVGAEWAAPILGLWQPVGVSTAWGVAWYVIGPEVVLGVCAYWLVARRDWPRPALVLLPFTYLGMIAMSYQFFG